MLIAMGDEAGSAALEVVAPTAVLDCGATVESAFVALADLRF
jgi:hypothetical protein